MRFCGSRNGDTTREGVENGRGDGDSRSWGLAIDIHCLSNRKKFIRDLLVCMRWACAFLCTDWRSCLLVTMCWLMRLTTASMASLRFFCVLNWVAINPNALVGETAVIAMSLGEGVGRWSMTCHPHARTQTYTTKYTHLLLGAALEIFAEYS